MKRREWKGAKRIRRKEGEAERVVQITALHGIVSALEFRDLEKEKLYDVNEVPHQHGHHDKTTLER